MITMNLYVQTMTVIHVMIVHLEVIIHQMMDWILIQMVSVTQVMHGRYVQMMAQIHMMIVEFVMVETLIWIVMVNVI